MVWSIVLFVISSIMSVMTASVNYCGARMCANTNSHTFCQFQDSPNPGCTGYIESALTKEEKARVMARLNRRRSEAASGRLRGLPPAGNMLKLRWVEELAREAQLWADQCRVPRIPEEHDLCRDLYSTTIGQCVASVVGEAPGLRVESMIDMWYMQNILYKGNVTSYIPPPNGVGFYGDFGQILWANTYMAGCGRSRFMASSHGRLRSVERLVCNFAPRGPLPSRALWSPASPASACSSRSEPDRVFTALCNYQPYLDESHDVDNSMTLEEHITLNALLEIEGKDSLNYQGSLDELYLTKLAIITMENTDISTPYYNSIQKRDIAEIISLEDAKIDVYKIVTDKDIKRNISYIVNMVENNNANKNDINYKRKLKFVGRPKSYDIRDLNYLEIEEDSTTNVHERRFEEVLQKEKDMLSEYGLLEVDNGNLTKIESAGSNFGGVQLRDDENSDFNATLIQNASSFKPVSEINNEVNLNINTTFNEDFKVRQNLEDYVNDSETVRELQEALDRMEQILEPTLRGSQAKVRRDLRILSEKTSVDEKSIKHVNNNSIMRDDLRRDKTVDRGPMINMVLRYMPYLKQYEDDILGKASSGSEGLRFSSVLYMCFISIYCLLFFASLYTLCD